ncbi:MAG: hypothetical protein ACI8WB_000502 [Phenylobacterium sp.]|jgi:hypothetical protein
MKLMRQLTMLCLCMLFTASCSDFGNPQQADDNFTPANNPKTFLKDKPPLVYLDEAHYNYHTSDGRYGPFVEVLKSDGYLVKANKKQFTLDNLKSADILVIANALNKKNRSNGELPNYPAFESEEVEAVHQWVLNGGSLFLIADHMPWPKASEKLAAAFGFKFNNGHAFDPGNRSSIYGIKKGDLAEHVITNGIKSNDSVSKIRTFGGQAFQIPPSATSLLIFSQSAYSVMPNSPFDINTDTPKTSVGGWSQGAVLEVGKGRIAVFGEACMFTAQININDKGKCGFLANGGEQNQQFLLNIMHWLSRLI